MVTCTHGQCTFEIKSKNADVLLLCADGLGCFEMTRHGRDLWAATLDLPSGHHHIRYYGRYGPTTLWEGEDDVDVQNQIVHDDSLPRSES